MNWRRRSRVAHGDRERDLRGVDPRTAHAHPPLHQRAEHGEEAAVGVVDRALVAAVRRDVGELVEQVLARDPDVVEGDPAVVDAVEAHLEAVVLDRDAVEHLAATPQRYDDGVDPVPLAGHLELGEHHGELRVPGGVADPVLASRRVGRGDDELLGVGVVRRDRAERLHVGAVPHLGHREAAHQPAGDQVAQVGVVVPLGAELQDRAAEQPELHADLHQHRQVAVRQRLERRDRRPEVAAPAVLLREAHAGLPGRGHHHDQVAHPVAEVVGRERLGLLEHRGVVGEVAAHQVADLGVAAVEHPPDGGHVELGAGGGGRDIGGHAHKLLAGNRAGAQGRA